MLNYSITKILSKLSTSPITPLKVCIEMVEELERRGRFDEPKPGETMQEYVKNHRICDFYCKSGDFLVICYFKFVRALYKKFKTPEELDYFICRYLLYAICPNESVAYMFTKKFYGNNKLFEKDDSIFGNFYVSGMVGDKDVENHVPEELKDMKFDVVVGNPPYNDGAYLKFVQAGNAMAKECSLWITPAKFMGATGSDATEFRDNILKYIEKVCYYPESYDVFDILEPSGICYYLVGKEVHTEASIENKCNFVKILGNSIQVRPLVEDTCLLNIGWGIISKIKQSGFDLSVDYRSSKFNYKVWVTNMPGYGGGSKSKHFFSNKGDSQILCKYSILSDNESYSAGQAKCVFASNNKLECESYVSYIFSKFVRFLVFCGFCSTTPLNNATFRFVPQPAAFDHIFTDEELYRKYNLSDDEIEVIESVIRERK